MLYWEYSYAMAFRKGCLEPNFITIIESDIVFTLN